MCYYMDLKIWDLIPNSSFIVHFFSMHSFKMESMKYCWRLNGLTQRTDGKSVRLISDQPEREFTFSKYLTSYSVRLLLGYDGSLHTKVMLFCSIFSAFSSLISDGAAERRRERGEICLRYYKDLRRLMANTKL